MAAIAYNLLEQSIVKHPGADSMLGRTGGRESKGWISAGLYRAAIWLAFLRPRVSVTLYALVAPMWIVSDRRIERILSE